MIDIGDTIKQQFAHLFCRFDIDYLSPIYINNIF